MRGTPPHAARRPPGAQIVRCAAQTEASGFLSSLPAAGGPGDPEGEHRSTAFSSARAVTAKPWSHCLTLSSSGWPQVVKAIRRGEHAAAPLGTTIWWAHRLLSGRRLLGRTQQRALIRW